MEAYNVNGRRPARAVAACIALGLAFAAVMVVLYPALRNLGQANRDYEAILGSAPRPGAGVRVLQTDAHLMDSGTRSATTNAVRPGDPAAHTVSAETKPMAGDAPPPTGTSDAAVKDTSGTLQSDANMSTYEGATAANDLKPALPADKGDPVATVSGWVSEPGKDNRVPPTTMAPLTPADDRKLCEWDDETLGDRAANADGHPEYGHVQVLGDSR